jgi:glycosyltransferase involved in cell wall biosynthesis
MKIVGVNHSGYNTTRNISSLPFKNFKVEKKRDFFKFPEHLYYRITGRTHPLLFNLHQDFGLAHCDLWHFFNTVSFTSKPWITTFETMTPRFHGKYQEKGVKLLAGKHCKKLIGMSEMAKNLQLDFIKMKYPDYYDAIAAKTIFIHPAQKLLLKDYSDKKSEDVLNFILVGTEFFRKGGAEVLTVFNKLLNEGKNIKLRIVSGMQYENSYATQDDYNKAMEIINRHKENIIYHSFLPNNEVLEFLLKSHVALLPSYRETYGYSILEAQASGCPVITTNILAFDEINNNNIGWMVNVPIDVMKRPLINSKEEREKFSEAIIEGLDKHIREILNNSAGVRTKAIAAMEKIKMQHNPEKVAEQLEQIYNLALSE